jgi:hypothetical protein
MPFLDDELIFEGDTKTLGGVLQNFGNDLQEKLRANLRTKVKAVTPKTLEQSILFDVKMESLGVWRFKLTMEDYGTFLDEGVRGAGGTRKTTSKFGTGSRGRIFRQRAPQSPFRFKKKRPPLDNRDSSWSLRDYARANNLNPFALQESIFRQGIAPTRWYTEVVTEKLISTLAISLERAGAKNIELEVVDILTGRTNAK